MGTFLQRNKLKMIIALLVASLCVIFLFRLVTADPVADTTSANGSASDSEAAPKKSQNQSAEANTSTTLSAAPDESRFSGFPKQNRFIKAAENENFLLSADPLTGHFTVTDNQTGKQWRSYANPKDWNEEENTDAWNIHLRSPFMFRYVEFNNRKDLLKETNFYDQKGIVKDFRIGEDGFSITYEMPNLGFVIPVEVRLRENYIETKIVAEGLRDERRFTEAELTKKADPKSRLVSVRLYPFFGAETSDREDGFLFIPDGMGAVVTFKKDRIQSSSFYEEKVYGDDWAYSKNNNFSNRKPVKMPVFGIKAGEQAFLAVLQQGEEYASIMAAPSKTFSQYNWAAAEHHFRFMYFQPTNTKKTEGFYSYGEEMVKTDRLIRYYLLEKPDADYVDMASAYREHLIKEMDVKPLETETGPLPLQLHLLGADSEKGFLWNSYLPLTTTDQAAEIVEELSSLGVESMRIVYSGWQKGGYSSYGGQFPVDRRLGGTEGMKRFIEFAHAEGHSVYLDASSYSFNSNGKDGFRRSRDALRDLGSDIIDFKSWGGDTRTLVSPAFVKKTIINDLSEAKSLGVDGLMLGRGVGDLLNTDYNENHSATREQSKQIQQDIFRETAAALGHAQVAEGNFYTLPYVNHVGQLYDDYSYDLFVQDKVPFAQIALHGLVSYSFQYANLSGSFTESLLRSIEYGAVPSFMVTNEQSRELLKSRSLYRYYSTHYKDWLIEMVSQYQRFNEAAGNVQDQFIVDHNKLAEGVYETVYSGGKRIWVNYNDVRFSKDGITVKQRDFTLVQGGS